MTRISIVTPSYNHAEFIEQTLQSVINQHYPDLEYLVIDGGSTDDTALILEKYRDHLAYVVSEPDQGQTDAIAKGFRRATGDILAWLNSDDIYEPYTLAEVAAYFEKRPEVDFIYGDALWIDRLGAPVRFKREISYNRFVWLHDYNYIPQPSTFWRRSLYEEVGGVNANFNLAMDADLWDRFALKTSPHHVGRVWSRMRLYPEQKNQALRANSNTEDNIIRMRNGVKTSGVSWTMRHVGAKGIRVLWKAFTGRYLVEYWSKRRLVVND